MNPKPIRPVAQTPAAPAYPLLIKQLLHTPLAANPDQEIVYRDLRRHDYWTFRHRIGQLASALESMGVRTGETVAIMDWDSHRYLESYFAVPMMGAVLMTVNVRLSPEQIVYTLNHSGAHTLLVHRDFLPLLAALRQRLDAVDRFVFIDDDGNCSLPCGFVQEYEAMLAEASPDYVFEDFDEDTRATTFYTTGTTGRPKGVCFSHRQIVLHTLSAGLALAGAAQQGRLHRGDVYMPMTPMFHAHAWGLPFVATLLGLKQVYPGRFAAGQLLGLIRRERVSFSHGVPTVLDMVLSHPDADACDLRGWKVAVGGWALSRELAQRALDRGIDVFTAYGMSETCPLLTISDVDPAAEGLEMRTKAGLPLPLVDLRVVDRSLQDVAHDGRTPGEIVVRAPWAAHGYLRDPMATDALWAGGYLHTSDIGAVDDRGHLQITDRIKDVIKSGGDWVSSIEIENLLTLHPAVAEAAVIGIRDVRWGERPLAIVVLRSGQSIDGEALKRHVGEFAIRGEVSRYAVPERIVFVDLIERTGVGKIDKKLLRQKHQPA